MEQNKSPKSIQYFNQINEEMSTVFMDYENSKTSDSYRLVLISQVKLIYEEVINVLHYQILVSTKHGEI